MKKRFFIFVGIVYGVLFNMPVFAKIATWQDTRRYVTNDEWASPKFNNFVHLTAWLQNNYVGNCTAQYVAPNIILSAGHCVHKKAVKYTIDRADKRDIPVDLLGYQLQEGSYGALTLDWALFLIKDSKYYKQDVFSVNVPNYDKDNIPVMNAGWGSTRILTAKDLQDIRADAAKYSNFSEAWDQGYSRKYREEDDKLKTSNCHILGKQTNKGIYNNQGVKAYYDGGPTDVLYNPGKHMLPTDCIANPGNSGGGIVSGNVLYGVTSYGFGGIDWTIERGMLSTFSNSSQFLKRLNELKQQYPATVNNPQNSAQPTSPVQKNPEPKQDTNDAKKTDTSASGAKDKDKQQQPQIPSNSGQNTQVPPATSVQPNPDENHDANNNPSQTGADTSGAKDTNDQQSGANNNPEQVETPVPASPTEPQDTDTPQQPEDNTVGANEIGAVIQDVENEKNKICGDAEKDFGRIKDMSDAELANFVAKAVYCKEREETLEKLQRAYDEAKAKEQSLPNRALTALSVAATGIGGMQLLQGLAEQSADKDAAADMAAYIETMRCTYGNGQQVKAGPEEIELPGANDTELMNLRGQYLSLAQDLKERKEALGMKPGIESELIMDRASTGLYDDENIGITSGKYGSLYRAQALNSESDQQKIADQQNTSSNRVKYGGIATGSGVAVGVAGDSLVNGKLNDLIHGKKEATKADQQQNTDDKSGDIMQIISDKIGSVSKQ